MVHVRMIRLIIFPVFLSIIIVGQNISDNRIKFAELYLTTELDPNAKGNIRTREAFRLYALYHEKLFENEDGDYSPNFTYRQRTRGNELKWVYMTKKEDLPTNAKSEFVMEFPLKSKESFRFHNGRVVEGADIVYSIKYAIEKKILDETIFKPDNVFLDDKNNLRIKLPYAMTFDTVIQYLGSVFVLPAPDSYPPFVSRKDLKELGAGPFRIIESKDEEIILNFFDDYRTDRLFDGIVIKHVPKRLEMVSGLMDEKTLNLIIDIPLLQLGDYKPGYEIKMIPRASASVLMINHDNPHLGNKEYGAKFRRAISMAIDRLDLLYNQLDGDGYILNGPFPKLSNYHPVEAKSTKYLPDSAKVIFKNIEGFSYNDNEELLFKGNKIKLKLNAAQEQNYRIVEAVQTIVSNLSLVGIEVNETFYLDDVLEVKIKNNKWDLLYWDYYPHPSSAVEEIFASYGENNFHHYKNADVDQLYSEFNSTIDVIRKNEIGSNIYTILKEDNASIFLWSLNDWYAFNAEEIHEEASLKIDGEAFFSEPHAWRPADK